MTLDPHLLALQRATQRKPKDASSARLNEGVNRVPGVVFRPDAVLEAAATQLDAGGGTGVEGSQEATLPAVENARCPSKRQSSPSQQRKAKTFNSGISPASRNTRIPNLIC